VLKRVAAALLVGAIIVIAGCDNGEDDQAPVACVRGIDLDARVDTYLRALQSAPGSVRLEGNVPISSCLVADQAAASLGDVGEAMVVAATKLNNEARRDPGGPAALELGYLLGAVSKGADSIHTDLVRRLNSAAHFSQTGGALPASVERAFGRGYQAGHESG
jgi:hypothetical protein